MFGPCGEVVWDDHEYVVLHALENLEQFYDEMLPYLRTFDIEDDIFADLLNYNKNIMRRPLDEEKVINLNYDVHSYLKDIYVNNVHALEKKAHTLKLRDSNMMTNWPDFGKFVIWYGRMGWSSYKDDVQEI
jgi:hypothetical protein